MNRLTKKCFIVSAGFHLLLAGILLVGPAFVSSDDKTEDIPIITFIPVVLTDEKVSGGGDPRGRAPEVVRQQPPTPQPPAPRPEPQTRRETSQEPVKATAAAPEPQPRKIEVSLKPVSRSSTTQTAADRRAEAEARERAEERRRLASRVGTAIGGLRNELSGSTSIELQGPGGGGLPYANWEAAVKKVYDDAWIIPDTINDDSAAVTVRITIARDGTVVSSSLVRRSNNGIVDQSVEAALERVRKRGAPPLPASSKDRERTVTIIFNVKTKLLAG